MSSQNQQSNITNQDLNDDFYKSSYFGIDIIIHKESGYINGNKLGFSMNSKKPFRKWCGIKSKTGGYYTKSTGELLRAVSKQTKIPVKDLIKDFSQIGGDNFQQVRGQYIHKYLVNALAMYYSVEYSVQVSILLMNLNDKLLEAEKEVIDGQRKKHKANVKFLCKKLKKSMKTLGDKEVEIKELVDGMEEVKRDNIQKDETIVKYSGKIDDLQRDFAEYKEESRKRFEKSMKKFDRVLGQNDDLKEQNDDMKEQADDMKDGIKGLEEGIDNLEDKVDNLEEGIDNLEDKVDRADNKLDSLVKSVVPKAQQIKLHEQFAMYEINDPTSKYSCQVYCVQNRGIKNAEYRIKKKYPNAKLLFKDCPNANAKNNLHRLKEKYQLCERKDRKIKVCRNSIELIGNTTIAELLGYIEGIVDERSNMVDY